MSLAATSPSLAELWREIEEDAERARARIYTKVDPYGGAYVALKEVYDAEVAQVLPLWSVRTAARLATRAALEWRGGHKELAGECASSAFVLDRRWGKLLVVEGITMPGTSAAGASAHGLERSYDYR